MTVAGFGGKLLWEHHRVVHEHVGCARELDGGRVVLTEAVLAHAEGGGAVVGKVGERGAPVAYPVSERATALVRDLSRQHVELLDLPLAGDDRRERPLPAELTWFDREVGRRHHSGEHGLRLLSVLLLGKQHGHARVGTVASREERQAENVIPMEMTEEDRAVEGCRAEQARNG